MESLIDIKRIPILASIIIGGLGGGGIKNDVDDVEEAQDEFLADAPPPKEEARDDTATAVVVFANALRYKDSFSLAAAVTGSFPIIYGNEVRLVFSSMKIGKADLRLKWKKWEMFVFCIFIHENR
jgi:hypothetical protein